jgi:hypothetical protein
MRKLILAAAGLAAAAAVLPMSAASAQYRGYGHNRGYHYGHYDRDVSRELRECRRELRRADTRREYRRELRECRREVARARWDDRYDRYGRYDRRYRGAYRWRGRW